MNSYEMSSSTRNYDVTSSVSNEQILKINNDSLPFKNEGFLSPNPLKKTQASY